MYRCFGGKNKTNEQKKPLLPQSLLVLEISTVLMHRSAYHNLHQKLVCEILSKIFKVTSSKNGFYWAFFISISGATVNSIHVWQTKKLGFKFHYVLSQTCIWVKVAPNKWGRRYN